MSLFTTKRSRNRKPRIHEAKDEASPAASFMEGDGASSIVEVVPDPEEDADWVKVRRQADGTGFLIVGWMRKEHLDQPSGTLQVPPVPVDMFIRACANEELDAQIGGDATRSILADYLIALAWIECGDWTEPDPIRSQPRISRPGKVGPYQFDETSWTDLSALLGLTPADRLTALNQIPAAAAAARRDRDAFSALARPDGEAAADGPYVPSFLNLFHAWLIGVPAAHEVDRVFARGDAGTMIGPILERHHPGNSNALMEFHAAFLRDAGGDGLVGGFVRRTTETLNDAFRKAGQLLVRHCSDFALPQSGLTAPWMDVAEQELQFWRTNRLDESSPVGTERVISYFEATNHPVQKVEHWCGAFIAYCLRKAGGAAASSVVPNAARAANWRTWGDIELHGSAAQAPRRGAIAVFSPGPGTGTSGHVAFLTGKTSGQDRVFCLGGNQSNQVREDEFPISRIVAVRWLDVADEVRPGEVEEAAGDPKDATDNDLLIMARTLYGEARGENDPGLEAVASVILNRVKSKRFPKTIAGVCLQKSQFSCWNGNDPNRTKIARLPRDANEDIVRCMSVAERARANDIADQTGGALHFHATSMKVPPFWVTNSPDATSVVIGNHAFYCGIT